MIDMDIKLFNDIAIGAVFHHPEDCSMKFIKFADADEDKSSDKQSPNCLNLYNKNYFSLSSKSPVVLIKEPNDYDETKLSIE